MPLAALIDQQNLLTVLERQPVVHWPQLPSGWPLTASCGVHARSE